VLGRIQHYLNDSRRITEVHENDTAVITPTGNPPGKSNFAPDIGSPESSGMIRPE
jgi:hypothetical protein